MRCEGVWRGRTSPGFLRGGLCFRTPYAWNPPLCALTVGVAHAPLVRRGASAPPQAIVMALFWSVPCHSSASG